MNVCICTIVESLVLTVCRPSAILSHEYVNIADIM